ncbi:MAG: cytidylate kinase [Betaproteobacteria bacterium]|nr:Cytidylate kinase [Rhodocyclaceae bacterium]
MTVPVIAIDGPSASGKGTLAARLAEKLGFHYLDSGALYRVVALRALRMGVAPADGAQLAELARTLPVSFRDHAVLLDDEDVATAIRTEEISMLASGVAVFPAVREALLARQRAFRRAPGLVAEGRDMGSVVFPDARVKVFLTASAEVRAQRRYKQLIDQGLPANIDALLQELRARDLRDSQRAVAPLVCAPDAILLDTTGLDPESAFAVLERIVQGH